MSQEGSQSYLATLKPSENMTQDSVLSLLSEVIPQFERVLKPGCHFYMSLLG